VSAEGVRQDLPIADHAGGFVNGIVRTFLHSNLSIILLVLSLLVGAAALIVTPREEDPQIVVPMADVFVSYPGKGAEEVEQLVTVPLERILYQIDGVEYVYSMSSADRAVITVRFRVGEDRERSLVKLFKRIEESKDLAPVGMFEAGGGWIMKPVEIDDVPIVTLTLRSTQSDAFTLRRVGEELAQRIAAVDELSRVSVVGGQPRVVHVRLDVERLAGYAQRGVLGPTGHRRPEGRRAARGPLGRRHHRRRADRDQPRPGARRSSSPRRCRSRSGSRCSSTGCSATRSTASRCSP
jgi:hypothetical protein